MRYLLSYLREFIWTMIKKGKKAEQRKAGEKWDSVVKELRKIK